jgi:hypothetical protein
MVTLFLAGVAWLGVRTGRERQRVVAEEAFRAQMERQVAELTHAQEVLAKQAERLRIVHEIDRAIIAEVGPEAIAAAVLQSLRALLGVPRQDPHGRREWPEYFVRKYTEGNGHCDVPA